MKWRKLGMIWRPNSSVPWQHSHAGLPTPLDLGDGRLRVYLYCQDLEKIGRVGYVDIDAKDPLKVIAVAENPVVDRGSPGTFDGHGVVPVSIVKAPDGRLFLYYVGFELCTSVRYRLFTGLAVSEDNGDSFRKMRQVPVLDRSDTELYFRCGSHVTYENGGFRLWYIGGSTWITVDSKMVPVYDMRYLEFADGVAWGSAGKTIMEINPNREHGFGRPYVLPSTSGGYEMFYSIRSLESRGYRMGYATSPDGISWIRRDGELGIDLSPEGWDSRDQSFPAVLSVDGSRYLFFNGNNFGETGFGVAVQDE